MIRDGGGVPPVPPIFNVDLPQSLEYPEGGRAKGINFASPLTHLLINIESKGVAWGDRSEAGGCSGAMDRRRRALASTCEMSAVIGLVGRSGGTQWK